MYFLGAHKDTKDVLWMMNYGFEGKELLKSSLLLKTIELKFFDLINQQAQKKLNKKVALELIFEMMD